MSSIALRSAADKIARFIAAELGRSDRATIADRTYRQLSRTEQLAIGHAAPTEYFAAMKAAMAREWASERREPGAH